LPDGIFLKPKIPNWVYLGIYWNGKCSYILWPFGIPIRQPFDISYGHLVHLVVIWYILPILVCCTKKNLATLV
jgi:hypothetical protein